MVPTPPSKQRRSAQGSTPPTAGRPEREVVGFSALSGFHTVKTYGASKQQQDEQGHLAQQQPHERDSPEQSKTEAPTALLRHVKQPTPQRSETPRRLVTGAISPIAPLQPLLPMPRISVLDRRQCTTTPPQQQREKTTPSEPSSRGSAGKPSLNNSSGSAVYAFCSIRKHPLYAEDSPSLRSFDTSTPIKDQSWMNRQGWRSAAATVKRQPSSSSAVATAASPNELCPRCVKKVFLAEQVRLCARRRCTPSRALQVVAAGRLWHKLCFRCAACGRGLQAGLFSDRGADVYCNACYSKGFGPEGIGAVGTLHKRID